MRSSAPGLAKLTRPKLHGVVRRERVCALLTSACARPLVWVTGPPGAGKTVAVASFIESTGTRSMWFQADAGDNDLSSFFYYLGLGARSFGGQRAVPLPLLTAEYLVDIPGYVRHFFRLLFDRMQPPAALVIDDYHEIDASNPLHALLEQALNQAPEGINLLLIGRSTLPRECARIDASDKLSRIEFDALRLDLAEARQIADQRYPLDARALEQLHADCDGWVAGFTLMLERFKHSGLQAQVDPIEVRASTFDYFASQIFVRTDPRLQQFLLETALLPHMSAAMAQELVCSGEAAALLEYLYRERLFTERRGQVYRYHDLFRDFLLDWLRRRCSSEDLCVLRRRAARILQQAGQVEAAFRLDCEAVDWAAAHALVRQQAAVLLAQGRSSVLCEWIDRLPKSLVDADPWIGYWFGMSWLEVDADRARTLLRYAFERMDAHDADGRMLAASGFVLTFLNDLANLKELDPWIDVLVSMIEKPIGSGAPIAEAQACAALVFALSHRRPERERLETLERRTLAALSADLPAIVRLGTAQALLMYYAESSNIVAGKALVAWINKHVDLDAVTPLHRSMYFFCSAYLHFIAGELETSNRNARKALEIAESNAVTAPVAHVYSLAGLAINEAAFGDAAVARPLLDAAHAHLDRTRSPLYSAVVHAEYMMACRRKAWASALEHARVSLAEGEKGGWIWGRVFSNAACALAMGELGRHAEAAAHLQQAESLIDGTALFRWRGMLRLTGAQVAMRRGDMAACTAALAEGFARMREDGAQLPIQMPGGSPPLLAVALAAGIEREFVSDMVRRFAIRPPTPLAVNWPWPIEIRTLGPFKVLRYGETIQFERKLPKRTLQLLMALIAFGGREVAQERIVDALWPDCSGDEGINVLSTTISRLRKLLDESEAVIQSGGRLTLNPDLCFVDAFAFEQLLEAQTRTGVDTAAADIDRALNLYGSRFLDREQEISWAVGMRERLRRKFVLAVGRRAGEQEIAGDTEAAIRSYVRGIDADELAEEFYRGLMRCYEKLGRRAEAMSAFRQLRQTLSVTLGIAPSRESQAVFESLCQ